MPREYSAPTGHLLQIYLISFHHPEFAIWIAICSLPPMRFIGLLALSLATASAQSDVGKMIFQAAADAVKCLEPIPEKDKSAILTCTAELLMKHFTFRPDGTASAVCIPLNKQHVEWKRLVVSVISSQNVNEADRMNGISKRCFVVFASDGHRTWDSKANAWGKWYASGHGLFPGGVTVECIAGKWSAVETDQMKYYTPGPGPSIATPKPTGNNAGLPPGMSRAK